MLSACVLVSHLPAKLELSRYRVTPRGQPLLVVAQDRTRKLVLDHSVPAPGVVAGMPLEQALACCPGARVVEADPQHYRAAWGRVLDALEHLSPVVEDAALGTAHVDLRGLDSLYGGRQGLVDALLGAVPVEYSPQVGVARGKFPAYAAAHQARPFPTGRVLQAPEDVASFLAPLPVTLLPTEWWVKERLIGFGLDTIGSLAALPVGALQGQFGVEGGRLWRLAHGQDSTPLVPRPHETTITVETSFAAPTVSLSAVLTALEGLLARAFRSAALRGRGARVATLESRLVGNGPPWTRRITFREPIVSPDQAMPLFRHVLESRLVGIPGPLETLSLVLSGITGAAGRQGSLLKDVHPDTSGLDEAISQLEARLGGKPPIFRIREVEPWSRLPERRAALVPFAH